MNKMKRTSSLIIFFLLAGNIFHAAAVYAANSLWQVQDGRHTLYLLGSLHVLQKTSYPLHPFIEEVYAASEAILFETDIDEMDSTAMQHKILSYGRLPTGHRLEDQLSPPTWQRLRAKITQMGLSVEQFQPLKPWFCALSLTVSALEKQGFLPQYGLDQHFFDRAKKDRKNIMFLESVDFQLSLFFSQSRREQEDFVKQSLADIEIIDSLAEEMEHAWKNGDADVLQGLIEKSFTGFPRQYERMVLQRNKNWIPILEKTLKKHEVSLVVVGAGHLVGPGSVVELMRQKGYKVKQR